MSEFDDVCILIPCFNEHERIVNALRDVRSIFSNVICIDDGSTDGTSSVIDESGVLVLRHRVNLGQGAALATGFRYILERTNYQVVVTFDGDGQHSALDAARLVDLLKETRVAVVLGTRFSGKRRSNVPLSKTLVLKAATFVTNRITGVRLSDTHNGLRAISRSAMPVLTPSQPGMAHASEMIHQIGKHELSFSEIPVNIDYRNTTKKHGQSLFNSLNIVWDLVWRRA